jgi:hypothetical protein
MCIRDSPNRDWVAAEFAKYPAKYHYQVFNPDTHPGALHDHSQSGNFMEEDNDCRTNPPTKAQVAYANEFAVEAAKYTETLPILRDHAQAKQVLPGYGFGFPFEIPFLGWIWDLAGWHWIRNVDRNPDPAGNPDAKRPNEVVYLLTKQGYRPLGIMLSTGDKPVPDFGGCLTGGHKHADTGAIGEALGFMLHIWTFGLSTGPYSEPEGCGWQTFKKCVEPYPVLLDHPDLR